MAQLDPTLLNQHMRQAHLPWRIHCYDSVSSTNLLVKDAIDQGEPEGYGAAALQQAAGYGRQGRSWVSPYGGVYVSVLLRPQVQPARLASIGPALSFAVRQALVSLVDAPDDILIKWPNDVVCASGKLCGMSCEQVHGAVCIGIGINLFRPATTAVVGGKNTPAYLADFSGCARAETANASVLTDDTSEAPAHVAASDHLDLAQARVATRLLAVVLRSLWETYRVWSAQGFAALQPDYQAHAALLGERISAVTITNQVIAEGTVVGIDPSGCLLVRDANKAIIPLASGEIHLR